MYSSSSLTAGTWDNYTHYDQHTTMPPCIILVSLCQRAWSHVSALNMDVAKMELLFLSPPSACPAVMRLRWRVCWESFVFSAMCSSWGLHHQTMAMIWATTATRPLAARCLRWVELHANATDLDGLWEHYAGAEKEVILCSVFLHKFEDKTPTTTT